MSKLTGGMVNYYLVQVEHPQREEQPPYQAECEDIAEALQLTPNEFCEFKAIWRTAASRLGNGKPDHKALYDAEKRVHYATRDLKKLQRDLEPVPLAPVEYAPGTVVEGGWIVHGGNDMPEALDGSQLVEVRVEGGTEYVGNFAKRADEWKWATDGSCLAITHYRLAHIKQPKPPIGEWKKLESTYMPEGLDPDEMVEVKLENGAEPIMAKRADKWDWAYRNWDNPEAAPHIAFWRRYRHQAC